MKFRKKPVVIDAVRIQKQMVEIAPPWLHNAVVDGRVEVRGMSAFTRDVPSVTIHTLEGAMRGEQGDWIIRGVKGELYPCRDDIFQQTYEQVQEGEA